jgi:hypothetical protein
VFFENPALPKAISAVEIRNLKLPAGNVDVSLRRHTAGVAVSVTRREGNAEVVVA